MRRRSCRLPCGTFPSRPAEAVFLLHGASGIKPGMTGTKVARLVLHYADGSRTTLEIVAGGDLLDCHGPIYQTDAGPEGAKPTSAGAELAWAGSNAKLARAGSEDSLRIYRAAFRNPHPEQEITSMDYVSTGTDAAPFLLGLTVE